VILGALGFSEELNRYFQLVPLEDLAARAAIVAIILADGVVTIGGQWVIRALLP
jgi:hypothetical protein